MGVGCAAAFVLALVAGKYVGTMLLVGHTWFASAGLAGVLAYCATFSLSATVLLPYSPFCGAVGYIWGVPLGFAVQTLAIVVSSAGIYALGRYLLKDRVCTCMQTEYPDIHALVTLVGEDWRYIHRRPLPPCLVHLALHLTVIACVGALYREAVKLNLMLCLVPMPYGTHAYVFSISDSPFLVFAPVFVLGMIPHTYINLALGAAARASLEGGGGTPSLPLHPGGVWFWALLASVLATAGVLVWGMRMVARRRSLGDVSKAESVVAVGSA